MAANNRRMSGKKGAQVGSGGKRRRGLEGKGPTPPAEMRKGHVKQRVANAKARRATGRARSGAGADGRRPKAGRRPQPRLRGAARRLCPPRRSTSSSSSTTTSGCARRSSSRPSAGGINLMEAPRPELDRMTNGLNHQGLVLQVPPYEYAHPEDLVAAAHDEGADPLIVALDGVTDPRNLGAIVPLRLRLRRPRRRRARAARGRHDGGRLEDVRRYGRPYAGRPRHQSHARAGVVPEGRYRGGGPRRRRRGRTRRAGGPRRPRGHRGRQRGQGALAARRGDVRLPGAGFPCPAVPSPSMPVSPPGSCCTRRRAGGG